MHLSAHHLLPLAQNGKSIAPYLPGIYNFYMVHFLRSKNWHLYLVAVSCLHEIRCPFFLFFYFLPPPSSSSPFISFFCSCFLDTFFQTVLFRFFPKAFAHSRVSFLHHKN